MLSLTGIIWSNEWQACSVKFSTPTQRSGWACSALVRSRHAEKVDGKRDLYAGRVDEVLLDGLLYLVGYNLCWREQGLPCVSCA